MIQYSNGKHKRVTSRSDKFKHEILFKSYVSGIVFKMQKKKKPSKTDLIYLFSEFLAI